MRLLKGLIVLSLLGSGLLTLAQAEDWPGFRGANSSGLATGNSVPLEWSKDKNVQWKVTVPGVAWSCPVVIGDKVFITTAITENQKKPSAGGGGMGGGRPGGGGGQGKGGPPGKGGGGGQGGGYGRNAPPDVLYQWEVHCLDKNTGKTLWKQLAVEAKPRIPTHPSNTFASETPVSDGERLYVYFGMMGLFCYDLNGKLLWKKDLGAFPMQMGWGSSSSPVVDGDALYLQIDNEQKSFLVALNKKTGEEVWKVDREEKTNWGTPLIWKNKVRTELVTLGGRKIRSYNPADGKLLWEMNNGNSRCCATPVGDSDLLYVGSSPGMGGGGMGGGPGKGGGGEGEKGGGGQGRGMGGGGSGGGLYAIKAGAQGDISLKAGETSNAGVAWAVARGGVEMASPLLYEGHVYIFSRNGGVVTCLDAKTGKQVYKERLQGAKAFWASPWGSGGKIYALDDGGTTYVLQAGPEFKVVSKNPLDEMFWATPAVTDGAIILRSVEHVFCVK